MFDAFQLKLFNDKFIENVDKNSKDFNQRLIEYVLSNLEDKKLPKGAFLANLENEIQKILNKSGYIQSANDFIGNAQTIKTEKAKTYGTNVKSLFDKYNINGFVMKGRNTIPELKKAIEVVYEGKQKYLSLKISRTTNVL